MTLAPVRELRADAIPLRRIWRDEARACGHVYCGCRVATCCLECPLSRCIYETGAGRAKGLPSIRTEEREKRIRELLAADYRTGRVVTLLTGEFGLSSRQVLRLIGLARKELYAGSN